MLETGNSVWILEIVESDDEIFYVTNWWWHVIVFMTDGAQLQVGVAIFKGQSV